MPEFGQALSRECVRDWKAYYINYNRLKGWINEVQEADSKEALKFFFEELETSLARVDSFYLAQEARIEQAIKDLCKAPSPSEQPPGVERKSSFARMTSSEAPASEEVQQARAILESIEKLRCFAQMNCDGFRKITKKFDKKVGSASQLTELPEGLEKRTVEVVKTHSFSEAEQRLDRLLSAVKAWEEGREASLPPLIRKLRSAQALGVPLLAVRDDRKGPGALRHALAEVRGMVARYADLLFLGLVMALLPLAGLSPKLSGRSYLVVWVTSMVLALLVKQFAADCVLVAATLFLTVCNILTPGEAWKAFSNGVVLSVAGLGVIASAVGETGVIDLVFRVILGRPKSLPVAMLRLLLPAMVLNIGISNTCVMSCLLPVIDSWSKDIGMHKAFFLMPLSYLLLISGVFAIFSTSTNLVAQGLLGAHHEPQFQNFDLAVPVALCSLVTIVYLLVATPIILKRFRVEADAVKRHRNGSMHKRNQNRYDVRIQIVGRHFNHTTLQSSGILDMLPQRIGDVYACERYGSLVSNISEVLELKLDDILWLRTSVDGITSLFNAPGLMFLALDLSEDYATLDRSSRQLVEAVLDRESPLIGHRIGDARKYRPDFNCVIVAFRAFNVQQGLKDARDDGFLSITAEAATRKSDAATQDGNLEISALKPAGSFADRLEMSGRKTADTEVRLAPGDHIIVNAPLSFYPTWKDSSDFVVLRKVTSPEGQAEAERRSFAAVVSGCILLGLIALVASSTLPLLEAVFVAIAALVLTGCTTMDFVVRSVKLRTVLTIVGAFGLGTAIGKERVAEVLADVLIGSLGQFGKLGLLVAIFAATVALGIIFHGTAVVVLMYPICSEVSRGMDVPIHQTIAVLCVAVSCQMLSPISYQTNLMAYSTGWYQFADFTKLGAGLVLCIALVSIPTIQHCFPG